MANLLALSEETASHLQSGARMGSFLQAVEELVSLMSASLFRFFRLFSY